MGKNKINLGLAAATFLVGAAVGAGIYYVQDSEPEPSVSGGIFDSYRTEEDCAQARDQSAPSYPEWELSCTFDEQMQSWMLTYRDAGVP